MTQLERELLRLYVEAEAIVAERYTGEHFASLARRPLTPDESREMLKFEFLHLIPDDAVVGDMLWRLCLAPPADRSPVGEYTGLAAEQFLQRREREVGWENWVDPLERGDE